jgi:hypothetical protein
MIVLSQSTALGTPSAKDAAMKVPEHDDHLQRYSYPKLSACAWRIREHQYPEDRSSQSHGTSANTLPLTFSADDAILGSDSMLAKLAVAAVMSAHTHRWLTDAEADTSAFAEF